MPAFEGKTPINRVLAALSQEDLDLLVPALKPVDLPLRQQMEDKNRRIQHVYFLERGIASVVSVGAGSGGVEIGIIGREGVTGLAVLMNSDRSPYETYMQLAGAGHRVSALSLRKAMHRSRTLQARLLRAGYAFTIQMAQTALANGCSKIDERLARWLLMAHDRIDSDELTLTHDFLAGMLGVRRPGVTVALSILEQDGLVQVRRGVITITDRIGLVKCANGAYGTAEAELRRLTN